MNSSDKLSLVLVAVITTSLMFLTAIVVTVLGTVAPLFVYIVCIPTIILLLLSGLFLVASIVVRVLHAAMMDMEDREHASKTKKADREHYYQHRRKMREIEREQYRQQLRPRQYRIKRCARHLQHLKRLRKDN
jgi:cytochrome b subunit of formate dehydrogenase